jgi:hypothetical protein
MLRRVGEVNNAWVLTLRAFEAWFGCRGVCYDIQLNAAYYLHGVREKKTCHGNRLRPSVSV